MAQLAEEEAGSSGLEQQLQSLRLFISVADAQSITRAAETIHKAPSAITRSIIELERAVGVPLFERKPRGMLLNAYGDTVLVRARRIQAEIEQATEDYLREQTAPPAASASTITSLLFTGRKLQLLIHLATSRNISGTAAHMNMSQAGASMALSRMEAVLGQPLFEQKVQGMVATDAATQLVVRARRVFAELRHMQSDLASMSGQVQGSVVIGTLPLGRTYIFPTAIAAAISKYPGLRVSTLEGAYEPLVGGLRSGAIDMAFGVLRPPQLSQGLITEPLFEDELAVVVRAGHPLASRSDLKMSDLLDEQWILPRANSVGAPMISAAFEALGLQPPTPMVETGDLAMLRQLLIASDMLAVSSTHKLMFEIRSGLLTRLPVRLKGTTRQVGLIVREGAMFSPAAQAVLEAVRAGAREP